jgi:hypothetical protein
MHAQNLLLWAATKQLHLNLIFKLALSFALLVTEHENFNTPSMQTVIIIVVIIKNFYLNTYSVPLCFDAAFTRFMGQSEFARLRSERF